MYTVSVYTVRCYYYYYDYYYDYYHATPSWPSPHLVSSPHHHHHHHHHVGVAMGNKR